MSFKRKNETVSASVETKLVDTLFDQYDSIVVGQIGVISIALLSYYESGLIWVLYWAVFLVLILPGRVWLARCYWRRSPSDTPTKWAYRFAIGSTLTSLSYGLASAASVLQPDQFLQIVIITGQGAYATISAVRNNAVPKVATLQGTLPLACLALACLATGNPYYMIYSVLVLFHLVCNVQIIRFMSGKTRDLLVAEERAAAVNVQLERLATTDTLTGAVNRRGFETSMSKALAHAARHREDLSVLLLDIDHFKVLNDTLGHQTGDDHLRAVATCLNIAVRPTDVVSRIGGEEFAILLPMTSASAAGDIAERVRQAIQALALPHPTSPSGVTTVSIGYATIERGNASDGTEFVKRADRALYKAKNSGRNTIARSIWEMPIKTEAVAASPDLMAI